MKNKLEEQMIETVNGASLKDLMPEFDKDAFWNELQPELVTVKKERNLLRWLPYAAAVLLIIVATLSIGDFSGNDNVSKGIAGAKKSEALVAPNNETPEHTAATVAQTKPFSKKVVGAARPEPSPKSNAPAQAQHIQESNTPPTMMDISNPPTNSIPVQQSIATTVPKRKVTHYLDIEETTNTYLPTVAEASFIQVKLQLPEPSKSNEQPKPIKELFMALAK